MITSTANEKVKFVKKLHDKKNRDAENLFIAEGVNILSDLKEGFSVKEIFATDKTADIAENLAKKYGACTTLVSESVMKVLAGKSQRYPCRNRNSFVEARREKRRRT